MIPNIVFTLVFTTSFAVAIFCCVRAGMNNTSSFDASSEALYWRYLNIALAAAFVLGLSRLWRLYDADLWAWTEYAGLRIRMIAFLAGALALWQAFDPVPVFRRTTK